MFLGFFPTHYTPAAKFTITPPGNAMCSVCLEHLCVSLCYCVRVPGCVCARVLSHASLKLWDRAFKRAFKELNSEHIRNRALGGKIQHAINEI